MSQGWFKMGVLNNNPANWDCGNATTVWIYGFKLDPSGSTGQSGDSGALWCSAMAVGGTWLGR